MFSSLFFQNRFKNSTETPKMISETGKKFEIVFFVTKTKLQKTPNFSEIMNRDSFNPPKNRQKCFFTPTVVFNFPQKTLPLNKKPSFLVCCDSQKTVHQNETNQTSLFLSSKFLFINLIFFIIKKIKKHFY